VFVSGSSKLRINYSQTGATLTVVDPSTEVTATLGSLPATGLNTVLIMSLVATLLGLGALMLLVTRRRRLTTK
jgi:LPXTG-motif cell wall-anchored protein